jgi:bacterioferritin-associated ferredoxin
MDYNFSPNNVTDCPERIVCHCLQVTETTLVATLQLRECRTLKELRQHTGAGDGCTACHRLLRCYLERHRTQASSAEPICSVK